MFQVFKDELILSSCMFLFLLLSILGKIMLGVLYQNMIKETENMRTTENKTLKQCKLKFANCYKLGNGISNVSVFVDKFLCHLKMGPVTTQTFYHLSGQSLLLSVLFAGVAVCHRIIEGASVMSILPFYIVCFLGIYLYFSVSAVADIKGRRKILKTNLVDFFENHMMNQLEEEAPEEIRPRQKIEIMPVLSKRGREMRENQEESTHPAAFSPLEQKELEDLLKEFLTS